MKTIRGMKSGAPLCPQGIGGPYQKNVCTCVRVYPFNLVLEGRCRQTARILTNHRTLRRNLRDHDGKSGPAATVKFRGYGNDRLRRGIGVVGPRRPVRGLLSSASVGPFERSEFLMRTLPKKCVTCMCVCARVYPFKLGFRVRCIYLILDCCRGYADRQGDETRAPLCPQGMGGPYKKTYLHVCTLLIWF